MKRLQVTTRIADRLLPPLYARAAADPGISELRVIDWNLAAPEEGTLLYVIDGETDVFREGATETDGMDDPDFARAGEELSYALVTARPAAIPFFSTFMALTARAGVVVRKPLVFRDARSFGRVVGDPGPLQRVVDEVPSGVEVQVEQIGTGPSEAADGASALSDRQRAALEAALELGYYNRPRDATHEDVADELGCAPTTATTHLQKGEAKLVRAALDSPGAPSP